MEDQCRLRHERRDTMKTKFWPVYLSAVVLGLVGLYFSPAPLDATKSLLSTEEMSALAGAITYNSQCERIGTGCASQTCSAENSWKEKSPVSYDICGLGLANQWCERTDLLDQSYCHVKQYEWGSCSTVSSEYDLYTNGCIDG